MRENDDDDRWRGERDDEDPDGDGDGFEWTDGVADASSGESTGGESDEPARDPRHAEASGADADASEGGAEASGADAGRDADDADEAVAADRGAPVAGSDSRGVDVDGPADDEDVAFGMAYGVRRERERNPEEVLTRPGQASSGLEGLSRSELREHYGPIRTFFKRREDAYRTFQRRLTQAWVRRTYDQYLATVVARAGTILAACVVAGFLAAVAVGVAATTGALPSLGLPAGTAAPAVFGVAVAVGVAAATGYWAWWRVLRIRQRVARRRREIDYNLPYAVTFMYALARADVNFDRIIARLADSTETYGAVGQEFDRVVRDVEMFGNNLYIGLENLRAVTPSEELERFVDDVMTVLESGGDLAAFLRDEVDDKLETAIAEQEQYIERLELLSEVFVVGFVAAPLFVLVVLVVVGFLGAETLPVIAVIVYAGIPLALAGFVVLVDAVSEPFETRSASFAPGREAPTPPPASESDPEWREAYEREKRNSGLRNWAREQVLAVDEEPWRALAFSVPLALAVPVALVVFEGTPVGLAALLDRPVALTTALAVAPLVVAATPVALAYEYRVRRERAFQRRFPDLLELLATSNRRGLSLARSLDIVTDTTSGPLGEELRALRNDVHWNADLPGAFEAFGDRLTSPALSRTVNLIAEGSRATSDLHVVLEVAATDTAERVRLARERRQTLQSYLVIVVIGFLVYLLVVVLLAANFLDPIEALDYGDAAAGGPISLGSVPVDELRLVLFHSALIQGFGSGLLAGKLAENSLYSGLKYGVALVVLAAAVFAVV